MRKVHTLTDYMITTVDAVDKQRTDLDDQEDQFLLISVGAKRVITAWKRQIISTPKSEMSFQWLSSDLPNRKGGTNLNGLKKAETNGNLDNVSVDRLPPENAEVCCNDGNENDWRYLAVTAFLVKISGSRWSLIQEVAIFFLVIPAQFSQIEIINEDACYVSLQDICVFHCCFLFRCHRYIKGSSVTTSPLVHIYPLNNIIWAAIYTFILVHNRSYLLLKQDISHSFWAIAGLTLRY